MHSPTEDTTQPDPSSPSSNPQIQPWNPEAVQKLIADAYRLGQTPVVLCLGRRETASLKDYLTRYFDDGEVTSLKNQVYAGLKIAELQVDSHLYVETLRSLYANSRHAEQKRIREAMKGNRLYPVRPPRRP